MLFFYSFMYVAATQLVCFLVINVYVVINSHCFITSFSRLFVCLVLFHSLIWTYWFDRYCPYTTTLLPNGFMLWSCRHCFHLWCRLTFGWTINGLCLHWLNLALAEMPWLAMPAAAGPDLFFYVLVCFVFMYFCMSVLLFYYYNLFFYIFYSA